MGVRLFNVSSMLSNLLVSADGKTAVVHLVNYSDYPVENVAVHFPAEYKRATLTTPEGMAKSLEVYPTEEGGAWTSTKSCLRHHQSWSNSMTERMARH